MAEGHPIQHGWRFQDLTEQTFGRLTVLAYAGKRGKRTFWHCRCLCGAEADVEASCLKSGNTTSCGCFLREKRLGCGNPRFKDLAGKRFGKLTALEISTSRGGMLYWRCRCECGREAEVPTERLTAGNTKSCGCAQYRKEPVAERFWRKVVKRENGCWEWIGKARNEFGYGLIHDGTRLTSTHRLAYRLTHGEIPEEICVLHHCDNPACVRPSHLWLGDRGDNAHDRQAKGRDYKGPRTWAAKLTEADVLEMRRRYRFGEGTLRGLAREFKVGRRTGRNAILGISWKHLPGVTDAGKRDDETSGRSGNRSPPVNPLPLAGKRL